MLLRKSYDALNDGGVFIAVENIIDKDRKVNVTGMLMSLNMLIETTGGFDYSESDFEEWAKDTGFKRVEFIRLKGASSAAIAYK
jgi:hypothetical protein